MIKPPTTNPGFAQVFQPDHLTLGLMFPMAPLTDGVPDMSGQLDLARRADRQGFAALWSRDVPLFDPEFGDAGQIFDPWVWLSQVAAATKSISLSTAGIVLPLRHPLHVAKAATSLDVISGGRFILGLASGDRPAEYPAFGLPADDRGARYRDGVATMRRVTEESYPAIDEHSSQMQGLNLLPKPTTGRLSMLAVGSAQQSVQWIARNMDGWVTYHRDLPDQAKRLSLWRTIVEQVSADRFLPVAQSMFIDLTDNPDTTPSPIFLGYRLGRHRLIEHLLELRTLGANHVLFNLRHSQRPADEVIDELAQEVLPLFPTLNTHTRAAPRAA
ncbi:MAG: LLM class oxidoreductase [Filomicrobium sp.]